MNRRLMLAALAVLLFGLALAVDHPVHSYFVDHLNARDWIEKGPAAWLLRLAGGLWLMLPTVLLLLIFHKQTWRAAALMALAAVVAGTAAAVAKGVFGRSRPGKWPGTPEWVPFRGGWYGFWHQTNVSFVSGDATQAFVWAEALAVAVPRLRWPAYAVAVLTGLQRVAAGAHWPSDVVAGAVLGVVTVRGLCLILSRVVPPAKDGPADEPV